MYLRNYLFLATFACRSVKIVFLEIAKSLLDKVIYASECHNIYRRK